MIGGLSFGMVSFLSPMEVVVVACAKLAAAAELLEVILASLLASIGVGGDGVDGWVSTWRVAGKCFAPSTIIIYMSCSVG